MMRPRDPPPLCDNSVVLPPALPEFSHLAGPFFAWSIGLTGLNPRVGSAVAGTSCVGGSSSKRYGHLTGEGSELQLMGMMLRRFAFPVTGSANSDEAIAAHFHSPDRVFKGSENAGGQSTAAVRGARPYRPRQWL
jgi:hypothetical protein